MSHNCPYAWLEYAAVEWLKAQEGKPSKPRFQLITNSVKVQTKAAEQRSTKTTHLYLVKTANASNEVRHA